MPIDAQQRNEFEDALNDAYTVTTLEIMLVQKMGRTLESIFNPSGSSFPTIVREVIEAAKRQGWEEDLIRGAIEANSGNPKLQSFISRYPEYARVDGPSPTPVYAYILYISTTPLETASDALSKASQKATPPELASSPSRLFELIKADAPKPLPGEAEELMFELREGGVVVSTFSNAALLLKFAFHIAANVKRFRSEGLRIAIHGVASAIEQRAQPTELQSKGIHIARRLVELGSAGHLLTTYETGEFFKLNIDFESTFNNKFDALFHVARKRELWPGESVDVYNIYATTHAGEGHPTTIGNEQPPKTRVPERVIPKIEVPRTLKELRKEKINITFWPDLPYVIAKFQFEDKKESNIKISCDAPEIEEDTFEFDFENHNDERKQVFDIKLNNRAKNRLVVLNLLCFDRYGKEIAQEPEHSIRLRRYFPLYWWDRFWFSHWHLRVALVLLACLVGYAGYRGYRYMTRPTPPPDKEKDTKPIEPGVVTEMPSVLFSESEELLRWQWDFSGQSIKLDAGSGGEPNKALVVTGPQRLLINPTSLGGKTFKDFVVFLAVQLRPDSTQAGWIFRASPDKKKGYIFILEKQRNGQFLLRGIFDEGDGNPLQLGFRQVLIKTCRDDDWIIIKATAHGNTFSHSAWIKSQASGCPSVEQPITPDFVDDRGRSPYGDVGIFVPEKNEVLVDYWNMYGYKP